MTTTTTPIKTTTRGLQSNNLIALIERFFKFILELLRGGKFL